MKSMKSNRKKNMKFNIMYSHFFVNHYPKQIKKEEVKEFKRMGY